MSIHGISNAEYIRELRMIYPRGQRVKVSYGGSRMPWFGSVLGHGSVYRHADCLRIVKDGTTSPLTIKAMFVTPVDIPLPRSLKRIHIGILL